ncbi:enoyl-CoA hydratase-related protein [Nakamurella lactea]|uniref:enoyl-CoA hydratase-related protein n=1 Tax=Nakamurella lactea TaxID=459515 RepID=UPI000427A69D|nr:enoyl-CoA hydratase-related protein [Nakamurella lactea]
MSIRPRKFNDREYTDLRSDLQDRVLIVTLDRPDRLNAYTPQMGAELLDVLDVADADDVVRAVVLTGAGRAFCAGADLAAGAERFHYAEGIEHEDPGGQITLRMFNSRKPLLVALNGPAVGIGATLPLAADVRLMSTTAHVSYNFARIGIIPEAASGWFLPTVVGISRALEWTMSGRRITPDEALAAGLVASVHPPDELLPAALDTAHRIIDHTAPVSVAMTRQLLWRTAGATDPRWAQRLSSRLMQDRGRSDDAREGITAFLDKRPARFLDRVSTNMPRWLDNDR